MPKQQPISEIKVLKTFPTKNEALAFMKEEREKFLQAGQPARFDVKKVVGTGRWSVTRQDLDTF